MPTPTLTQERAPNVGTPTPELARRALRLRRYLVWAAVLLAFGLLFWWGLHRHGGTISRAAPAPVTVVPATAQQANVPVYLDAIGTVTPLRTVTLASQVSGQVMSVHYDEGQLVKQGMLLVEIDPRPFAATLLQAQGTLERDTQLLAQATMDLDRYRTAWAKNAIAKQQLDDQEKLVLQTEGTVKNDRGSVQFDEVQLGFCRIAAPITGRVGLRLVDPGNTVSAASPTTLAVITQVQPISVVFTVPEDDLGDVLQQTRRGDHLAVEALDRAKSKTLGSWTLGAVDNQIDTTTGTVKLRAVFDNADEALFPNQFVNTRLLVRTVENATTVPSGAVQHDSQQAFVYVLQDAHAHVQPVTIGVVAAGVTQVEGIAPGTVVANGSFEKLHEGAAVVIGGPASPAATVRTKSPP